MKKQYSTKRALLLSALSLLMCVSMLVGSTFAWFTDSVTSAGNKIQAGNLAVDLKLYEGGEKWDSIKTSNAPIFNYSNWEPGFIDTKLLKVVNEGSLALKWKAKITTQESLGILADVIDVFVKPDISATDFEALTRDDLATWTNAGTVRAFVEGIETSTWGTLNPMGTAGDSATLGIALKMREEAGNEYMKQSIGPFDIMILATQLTSESDSFDNQYDKDAQHPQGKPSSTSKIVTEITGASVESIQVAVDIPADAPEGDYKLEVSPITFENTAGKTTMSFDMKLLNNSVEVENSSISYPVTLQLPHHLINITDIKHNRESVGEFHYDPKALTVSFYTNGFSPFSIEYVDYADPAFPLEYEKVDVENNQFAITKGIFVGKNPVDFDASLANPDSKYLVIDYVRNGVTYYAVSERATSLIVAADDASEFLKGRSTSYYNNDLLRTNVSGNLWKAFVNDSRAYKLGAKTVYLLPGTYTEGTTLTISTDIDVIGVGDIGEIKVVKGNSTGSNRHLFNCTGTSADYIHVTLRNMTLEVPCDNIKNSKAEDNAAVQVIRKTKVKCYDLVISKAPATVTWENAAFYVNANNAVDGVKYPAYLYVENTTVNATNDNYTHKIYALNNSSQTYLYHYDLKYADGAKFFDTNSGKIKHTSMDANDWIWD